MPRTAFPVNGGYASLVSPASAIASNEDRRGNCRRYFQIAGITVLVESDFDVNEIKFNKELIPFAVDGPGSDNVTLRHYFELPDLRGEDLGKELYRRRQWSISRKNGAWIYRGVTPDGPDSDLHRVAVFNSDLRGPSSTVPRIMSDTYGQRVFIRYPCFPATRFGLCPCLRTGMLFCFIRRPLL